MTMDIQFVDFCFVVFFALTTILPSESIEFGNEYSIVQTVLLHDGSSNDLGYQLKALLKLQLLTKDFYMINLENPKLFVFNRKNKKPKGFVPHVSNIDRYENMPFYVEVSKGKVKNVYISKTDNKDFVNFKKGIASLFQFQTTNYQGQETDMSGTCNVHYQLQNPNQIIKTKDDCMLSNTVISKSVWGGELKSKRKTNLQFDKRKVETIISWEEHVFAFYLDEHVKANVSSKLEMQLVGSEKLEEILPSGNIEHEINQEMFDILDLVPEEKEITCINCPRFGKVISENGEYLKDTYLGSSESSSVFIKAIKAARRASVQEVYNAINAKKNKKILPQLLDILGVAQTINTHHAAMTLLKIDTEKYDLDLCERYFWALSMAPSVKHHIVEELRHLVQNKHPNNKLWQTIVLTLAAVVNKYATQTRDSEQLVKETIDFFASKIKECSGNDDCLQVYIKALSNIPHEKGLTLLEDIIEKSRKKSGARAMKVISKMDPSFWNNHVIKLAEKVLLTNQNYDTSSGIFAVDILLRSKPSYIQLCRIVSILKHNEKSRELKEYLLQRLAELSESCSTFKTLLKKVFAENGYNHYDTLSQGGLSTTFSRPFMSRGILSTTQEIIGGVLKQGSVNVNLLHNGEILTPFTLGIFAGGLSSFVSTEDDNTVDDEASTAGLELTVLGTEVRPFVFFNGTGELMGHVWSGTASSLTPAYQALLLLDESAISVPLSTGEILNIQLESSASVDLSGKIEISLWNRNADSIVSNRAGVFIKSSMSVNTPYVETDMNVELSIDPELRLAADLEFSSGASLCLRLQQPKTLVKWNSYKSERIPGTNHMSKRSRHLNLPIPGKTYSLNSKNNDMCNKVFN